MSAPAMSHTQLIDSIIQKKKSKKPIIGDTTLPYLQELLSLNDLATRKAKARELCSTYAEINASYGSRIFQYLPRYTKYRANEGTACSCISSVFGEFNDGWVFSERRPRIWANTIKCGIEVLNAQPNATGSTYSTKCRITVKELKEACKMNGIKATGDKKALLSALMKL